MLEALRASDGWMREQLRASVGRMREALIRAFIDWMLELRASVGWMLEALIRFHRLDARSPSGFLTGGFWLHASTSSFAQTRITF